MKQQRDIVIEEFQNGIGDSAHVGLADMRNIDVYSEPGIAKINYALREATFNNNSGNQNGTSTFTVNAGNDTVTTANGDIFLHEYYNTNFGQPVTVSSSGTLPAGLTANTVYYIFGASSVPPFKLASTYANADAGTPVDITDAGSGTHTITAVKPGETKHQVSDPATGFKYTLDTNGRVWKQRASVWYVISGNTLTSQSANGLAIWKGYLLVFRNTAVDLIPLSTIDTNATWTNSWKSDLTSGVHHAIHSQDDKLYLTNDRHVASLAELTTFDPASSATYTWNVSALDVPSGFKLQRLRELGHLLMAGGHQDNVTVSKSSRGTGLPLPSLNRSPCLTLPCAPWRPSATCCTSLLATLALSGSPTRFSWNSHSGFHRISSG